MPSGAAGREAGRSGQARRPRCRAAAAARTTPAVHTAGRGPGPETSPLPPAPPGRQSSPEERCPRYSAPSWPHRTGPRMRMEEADAKARMGQQKGHQDTRSDPFLPTGAWKSAVLSDRSRPSTKLEKSRTTRLQGSAGGRRPAARLSSALRQSGQPSLPEGAAAPRGPSAAPRTGRPSHELRGASRAEPGPGGRPSPENGSRGPRGGGAGGGGGDEEGRPSAAAARPGARRGPALSVRAVVALKRAFVVALGGRAAWGDAGAPQYSWEAWVAFLPPAGAFGPTVALVFLGSSTAWMLGRTPP